MRTIQILNSPNWSGASNYCITLCRKLMGHGHEVLLLTEPGKPLERARKAGIPCDDTIRLNHRNPGLYLHAIKRMARLFADFRPDIISSHINEGAWMAGMVARRAVPEATVVRVRTDIDPPKGHFINRYVHHAWTDHLIVGSQLHKRLCRQILGFPDEGIDVVYGAVDTDEYSPNPSAAHRLRDELGIANGSFVIGLVARLDPVKGHEYALDALRLLLGLPTPVVLACIGYESNRTVAWLKGEAERLGVADRLRVTMTRRDDLPVLINGCDAGLVTSIGSEANCRAALEFMASGKPVVATTVGVIPEIIQDGEQGFLVQPRDAVGLAHALQKLVINPALRRRAGLAARSHALANFNLDLFASRTESVYRKAIARKQPRM
ncbi:MAG TPA: glycosyltransferase family 4 protein [Candidatus Ozemobacteraceae bacterium]|nr:glycosyltransferase family 4 protein [Candidatus Ozemobacteraceae bacterium]HQG29902.1 glycosyltransferase family 4 protein [Candidatus Ozemobacteraceae bacterium]